jgi:hypothetical protein
VINSALTIVIIMDNTECPLFGKKFIGGELPHPFLLIHVCPKGNAH